MPDDPNDILFGGLVPSDPNRAALADPRVKGFLDKIGRSEGADYNTLVGGSKIDDLSRHPNKVGLVTSAGPSTAFGKYQITGTTNRSKLAKYSHLDYSPENQDLRAVELLRQTKALDALQQGDEPTAIKRAGTEWASLPGSRLPGRKRTDVFKQSPQNPILSGGLVAKPSQSIETPDILSGGLIETAQPSQSAVAGSGRGAGMARAGQVAARGTGKAPPGWEGSGTIGQGITTLIPATAARTAMNRPTVQASSAGRSVFALSPEEQMRVTPQGTITPTTNRLVVKVINQINQKEQADIASKGLSNIAAMGGVPTSLLPKDAEDWINSAVAQGGAGLMNTAAGLVRHGIPALEVAKMFGAPDVLQKPVADKLQSVSSELSGASQAIDRNADRGVLSQGIKDVVGGGIATTPAMILVSLGVPPPVAFGMQSFAEAQGRDADLADTIKETTKGAAIGALFELPLPSRIAMANQLGQRLAKAGIVGVGTKAVDLASGANPNDLRSPIVNALFAASGAPKSGRVVPLTESSTIVPDINAQLAAREASVKPVTDAQGNVLLNADEVAQNPNARPKVRLAQRGANEAQRINQLDTQNTDRLGRGIMAPADANQSAQTIRAASDQSDSGTAAQAGSGEAVKAGESLPSTSAVPEVQDSGVRHVDLQSRRTRNTEGGSKGQFKPETPAQAEARRAQVASSVTPQPDLSTQAQPAIPGNAGVASMPLIRDVTPEGYGPVEETPDTRSLEAPHLTTEQSALKRSISEAETLLKGRMSPERKAAIQQSLDNARQKLDEISSPEERIRQSTVRLATDAEIKPPIRTKAELKAIRDNQYAKPDAASEVAPMPEAKVKVYRGSTGTEEESRTGVTFYSPDKNYAAKYGPNVRQTELDTSNFFDTRKPEHKVILDTVNEERRGDNPVALVHPTDRVPFYGDEANLRDALKQRGYNFDGMVVTDWTQRGSGGIVYAKYKPETSRAAQPAPPVPEGKASEPKLSERSFPKTLAATGRATGTDLTYEVVGDKDAVDKATARITADPESALQFALSGNGNNATPQGKERIATGLKLADQLASQAENSKDPVDAATKHAQAIELYTKTATDLTEAGQTVQAASLAQKYSLTGAPLEVIRIAKRNGNIPKASDISDVRDMAKRQDDLESRLADVQKQIETMQANGKKVITPRAKVETLADRLAKMESDARARLDARAKLAQFQTVGPKGQRGSGINPVDVAASIADWTTIGAAKIARGGINFASWSKEMISEFGDAIKPHLDKIFMAAHKIASEQRASLKEESTQRSATKAGMSLEDFKQQRYELQVQKRQARLDMDRKFKELDRRAQRGPLKKTGDAIGSVLTNSLLSYHGLLNILSTMTAKEAINTALRVPEAGLDLAERGIARTFGKQIPRASAGLSPRQLGRAVKSTVTEGPGNIAKAFLDRSSEVMPRVHEGPLDNPKLNLILDFMSRHYAAKEALIRTPTYNLERSNQASIMAHNDITDGIIKRSQLKDRIDDYLNGRASMDGPLNKKYAASLADQAADYEIKSRNPTTSGIVTPSAKAARIKEMMTNPTQLIDSQALQYADKEVYANPFGPRMQKIQDALNAGGPIPKALIQPFFKRPVNAFNDLLYSYTGAKAVKEGSQAAFNALRGQEWTPTERQSFNRAVARGGTVYGLAALGYALAGRGLLTSGNDKDHPGSLKVGNSYYAIGNKPVIGWAIVAGATAKIDGASAVPGAVGRMVLDHPLLKGLKNVTDAAQEGYQAAQGNFAKLSKAATGFASKTLSRAIPTPIAATAETMDTQNRDTSGLTGPLKARIPFMRQQLPPTGPKERGSAFDPFLAQPIRLKPRGRAALKF